ncbi:MAG: flagellar motor switch protein FliN [Nitrospirae bacterium]|nr:MAG: flagellar motor switch protein FliN [Nitrospirota bacterium]
MSEETERQESEAQEAVNETESTEVEAGSDEPSGKLVKSGGRAVKATKSSKSTNPEIEKMERILDIPLVLSAQLGTSRMLVKELLQLGPGSVVELDKLAGEPLEVLVNDKLVARGEVVMVNEKFGVRLTDVVSPTERVQKLR